jgi:hypothetical protein
VSVGVALDGRAPRVPVGLTCARIARRLWVNAPRLTSAQIGRPSNFTVRVIGIFKSNRSRSEKKITPGLSRAA